MSLYGTLSDPLEAGLSLATWMTFLREDADHLKSAISRAKTAPIRWAAANLKDTMNLIKQVMTTMTNNGEITPEEVLQYNREATKVYEDAMASKAQED